MPMIVFAGSLERKAEVTESGDSWFAVDRSATVVGKTLFAGLLVVLTVGAMVSNAAAQSARGQPAGRPPTAESQPESAPAKLDIWTLQTLGEVTLHSPVVRLKDIVLAIGIPDTVWEQLGPAVVTLVPTDGRRLTIERQRLLEAIQRRVAPEQHIRWSGPELIYVQYRGDVREVAFPSPAAPQTTSATDPQNSVHKIASEMLVRQNLQPPDSAKTPNARQSIWQTAYAKAAERPAPQTSANPSVGEPSSSDSPALPTREIERLTRLIESAIEAEWPELAEKFDFAVASQHDGLQKLRNIRRVEALQLNEPVRSGSLLVQINGATIEDSVTAEIKLQVSPRPEGLFVRYNIRRGQRIQRNDLERRPLSRSQVADSLVEEIDQIVGMEARTGLNQNRPLRRDDVKAPTVIHRGDLVELRVAGGGIIVRSNAKAMGDGAVGELIEVETQQPRKRLMASVVQTGQVEIVTRAPNLAR